jgi:hypothetical protein
MLMDDLEMEDLLEDLQNGRTILILGPEAHLIDRFDEDQLPSHFEIILNGSPALKQRKGFDLQDGFFLCNNTSKEKSLVFDTIKKYYDALQPPQFYQWLAALPFSATISLSPDNLMEKCMQQIGYDYDFVFYKKGTGLYQRQSFTGMALQDFLPIDDLEQLPTPSKPLLLNLLGYYPFTDSLMFTYESLFDFMYSTFPVGNLPNKLRLAISNTSSFLFVGFGYHQWYLKIIFFLLEKILKDKGKALQGKAIFNYGDSKNATVETYQQVFPISFYKNPTASFAQKMYTQLKKERGYEKPLPAKQASYRVLFMASLPDGKMPLRPDKDWQQIDELLAVQKATGKFELRAVFCADIDDVMVQLNAFNPNMLVLSMHGTSNGLFFENDAGEENLVDVELFKQNIETSQSTPGYRLECVVLGACHSDLMAQKLLGVVPHTIGMNGPIRDEAVRHFSKAFFTNFPLQLHYASSVEVARQMVANQASFVSDAPRIKYYTSLTAESLNQVNTMARTAPRR